MYVPLTCMYELTEICLPKNYLICAIGRIRLDGCSRFDGGDCQHLGGLYTEYCCQRTDQKQSNLAVFMMSVKRVNVLQSRRNEAVPGNSDVSPVGA